MIDSWGRLPAGILQGNLKDLGNYDECIRVDQPMANTGQSLRGKYCLAKLAGSDMGGALATLSIKTAICLPASCTVDHIDLLLRQLFQQLLNLNIEPQMIKAGECDTAEQEPLDGLAIFTM